MRLRHRILLFWDRFWSPRSERWRVQYPDGWSTPLRVHDALARANLFGGVVRHRSEKPDDA